jgi:hypothetical protein
MADDRNKNKDDEDFGALTGGSGDDDDAFRTSSLPPLSDFDSQGSGRGEGQTDSDLPPLDTPGSGGDDDDEAFSGLPPIVDIRVDTPAVRPSDLDTPTPSKGSKATPSKGRVTPPRSSGAATTPSPAGFKTPSDADLQSPSDSGFGFQDFAADSDFSPETPEIGPGPDSDIETPMFDSAFGGDSDEFGSGVSSSAQTQAMQTPMFGQAGDDAFGGASPDFGAPEAGTPVPDFSPDTGAGLRDSGATPQPVGGVPARRGSRAMSIAMTILALIVGVAAGAFLGPYLIGTVPGIANPFADDIADKDRTIDQLNARIRDLTNRPEGETVSPEELQRLIADVNQATADKARLEDEKARILEEIATLENRLTLVKADIEDKNNEFVEAQEFLEDLRNETAITQARHTGLLAENERLTELVGELEVANARRAATKDTLEHNTDLLIIQIQGGSPLTPERYAYDRRLVRAQELRDKIAAAKWVDPQLLDEYTSLYLSELAIASSREYFYARIPVQDQLGNTMYKWAECLMNGNWSVYFRTLDGSIVGSYENVAGSGPPQYEFRQDVQQEMRADIVAAIESARPEDWEEKFKLLKEKEKIYEAKTDLQRDYDSLQ